jgi:hypothetical protein
MANYKEQEITGSQYQRACRVIIENALDETPTVNFVEEEITILPNNKNHKLIGSLQMTFDPNEMVTMVDPETNELTETVYPASLAQWIIYSLYFKKANERDNPVAPIIEPEN